MPEHPLDPLLKPGSIALVGASAREGTPGFQLANMVIHSRYPGKVFPVNPGYASILGKPCYPDLKSLPQAVDHVVMAVSNARLESVLIEAIEQGAKAGTIYENCYLENDPEPSLNQRLASRARTARFQLCGGNCMGFYNVSEDLYVGIYPFAGAVPRGSISFIAQSGSAFASLAHNGCRLQFNLCVSSGNEMVTTLADYMSWSLEQESTRVIGLFLETVRDPEGFTAALRTAAQKRIPVVVLKVGKSPLGEALANTHTGAIVGNHAAYQALFRKYGVIEVNDLNELAATLMLFQAPRRAGPGKLASIQESGGFRELVADGAHELGIGFAPISPRTRETIQAQLEPGLVAENPLDAWGTNQNFEERFCACLSALMKDENVSVGMFFTNFKDDYYLTEAFYRNIERVSRETTKPLAMVNCYSDLANTSLCRRSSTLGIPLIDGSREALLGARHLFRFRDFILEDESAAPAGTVDAKTVARWKTRLESRARETLDEAESMDLLQDFSIPVPDHARADNLDDLLAAASEMGYPVALKTAATAIHHKSDHHGVALDIASETDLVLRYGEIANRLGPRVLVSRMVDRGTEVGLGVLNDGKFGPFMMVSAGGIFIELLADHALALAPVSHREADKMLASLPLDALIRGTRGRRPGDRTGLVHTIVALSNLAHCLQDHIREIDVNPVIVTHHGVVAVDALVVTR